MTGRRPKNAEPASAPTRAAATAPEAPTQMHRLAGLEPDNFLAFLALLGLLRTLDTVRPDWKARAHWDLAAHPLRPVLTLREPATATDVAAASADGLNNLGGAHDFEGRKDINYTRDEARCVLERARAERAELLAALMSDAVLNDKDQVSPTPVCLLFGQGHQHFLERLAGVPAMREPPQRGKGKTKTAVSETACLAEALFAPWDRPDLTDGFRWDPAEDRRYALRADDPSGDSVGLQHGANRLAAIALTVLSGAAILRRGKLRFLARATSYKPDGAIAITWPIWSRPARLSAIRALLAHPVLGQEEPDSRELTTLDVIKVMRAGRITVGKFMNITPAHALT